jgi:Nucleotidyl transferase AbiEii toxin, Type IV TA system
MSGGDDIYRKVQAWARSEAAKTGRPTPTAEYLTRHMLESFLDRLTRTRHAQDFVLKGGILLASYGVRRPTKDLDAEAISADITAEYLTQVVRDIVAVDVDDGVDFDVTTITVREIREQAEYPGLRLRMKASIGSWVGVAAWDISTGDPIVPQPEVIGIPRVLGGEIEILAYRPETTVAEKGVTILERGTTSTRWRDYVDIVQLFTHHQIDRAQLLVSARAVARYRGVALGPIAPGVIGYGAIAQQKWAAWRRKEGLEDISEASLDSQMELVSSYLDPVFSNGE